MGFLEFEKDRCFVRKTNTVCSRDDGSGLGTPLEIHETAKCRNIVEKGRWVWSNDVREFHETVGRNWARRWKNMKGRVWGMTKRGRTRGNL